MDLLPTLCEACGVDLKSKSTGSPKIDGVSVWNTLTGKGGEHARKDLLYWNGMGEWQAIRVGKWKLYPDRKAMFRGYGTSQPLPDEVKKKVLALRKGTGPLLFNLEGDAPELVDLSAKHPERVKEMMELAEKKLVDIKSNIIPTERHK